MRASPSPIFRPINRLFFRRPHQLRSYQPPPANSTAPSSSTPLSRADRILDRLPGPLQKYASRLRGAPGTHVVAFLLLHEITAIIPVFALFGLFHYTDYVPIQDFGMDVKEGAAKMIRYLQKKGLLRPADGGVVEGPHEVAEKWESYKDYRILVEFAAAYAVTKVLLPVRIAVSLWATPWFAGVLGGVKRLFRR
ncbi:protein family FLILHELTA [Cladorrhinum sp. PSN332]|nr:protein family FLILHELTA [Cladorrhinum sp. PSN332]